MRNRELGVLIIGLLCIALPAVTEWLLPLHGLEPDLGTSSMYTEQERMDAAKAVARYCDDELLRLTYLGDGQAARETSRANDFGYEESISLSSGCIWCSHKASHPTYPRWERAGFLFCNIPDRPGSLRENASRPPHRPLPPRPVHAPVRQTPLPGR